MWPAKRRRGCGRERSRWPAVGRRRCDVSGPYATSGDFLTESAGVPAARRYYVVGGHLPVRQHQDDPRDQRRTHACRQCDEAQPKYPWRAVQRVADCPPSFRVASPGGPRLLTIMTKEPLGRGTLTLAAPCSSRGPSLLVGRRTSSDVC